MGSISFNAFSADVPPSNLENDLRILPNMISMRKYGLFGFAKILPRMIYDEMTDI
jgi:hypothetical protein